MESLGLTEAQTSWSWGVLKDYGNMLSPSILFVIERIFNSLAKGEAGSSDLETNVVQNSSEKPFQLIIAFSFSPGVGIEGCLIKVTK